MNHHDPLVQAVANMTTNQYELHKSRNNRLRAICHTGWVDDRAGQSKGRNRVRTASGGKMKAKLAAAAAALTFAATTTAGAAQPPNSGTIELASATNRTTCQIVDDDYGWVGGAICIHRTHTGWPDGWFAIAWAFWCTPTAWHSNPAGTAKIVLPDGCAFPGATHALEDGEQATYKDGWVTVLYGPGVVRNPFAMAYMEIL